MQSPKKHAELSTNYGKRDARHSQSVVNGGAAFDEDLEGGFVTSPGTS